MTKEEAQALLAKLNKAKIGGEDGAGQNGFGTDLSLKSHIKFGFPSRVPELDLSIGRPGYPAGRVVELYGLPGTGKTTAAYHALAQCQKMGGLAVFIDTELSFDMERAAECGVDPSHLMILEAGDIEEIFEKIDIVTDAQKGKTEPLLIAVDSITAVQTRYDSAREIKEGTRVGEHARIIRQGLQRLNQQISESRTCVLFINHAIALVGRMANQKQSDSAGGNAIKFYSSIRLEFQKIGEIKTEKGEDQVRRGQMTVINVAKNKVAATGAPSVVVELTENGFDFYDSLWKAYTKMGAIEKINNLSYHFLPTKTTMGRKEWKGFVDSFETKNGKVLGPDGFYKHFLTMATNDEYIKPYGVRDDAGDESSPTVE